MRFAVTLDDARATGTRLDVLLDVQPDDWISGLLPHCLLLLGDSPQGRHSVTGQALSVTVDGVTVNLTTATVRTAGLRPGSVIGIRAQGRGHAAVTGDGVPLHTMRAVQGVAELRVVNGVGAGRIHRLAPGRTSIGYRATGMRLADPSLPVEALVVIARVDGVVSVRAGQALAQAERLELDGVRLGADPLVWTPGTLLVAGNTVLELAPVTAPDADVTPAAGEAGLALNRPPRLLSPAAASTVLLPARPTGPAQRSFPWIAVVAPAVISVPMALLFGPRFLVFAAFSPLMMLANLIGERRSSRREHRRELQQWRTRRTAAAHHARAALAAEAIARRNAAPDPASTLLTALGPGRRLWERRHSDADHLVLRLGLADLAPLTTVENGSPAGPSALSGGARQDADTADAGPAVDPLLRDVPVTVDLAAIGVLGIAGPAQARAPLAQWLIAQAAAWHPPRGLRLVILTARDEQARQCWQWSRWLPHLQPDPAGTAAGAGAAVPAAGLGNDTESIGRRLAELTALISERAAHPAVPAADLIVVLDGARRLRTLPAVVTLLREGPSVGVYSLCLDDEQARLPQECAAVVTATSGRLRLQHSGRDAVDPIRPDGVEAGWLEAIARALAPIRDATPDHDDSGLPALARLLDLLGLDPPSPEAIRARRRRLGSGGTTRALIGAGFDGPFEIDLQADGPHALIAGTTGAGKSELLQTLIASLAVANHPGELQFVLIDYKGGSAFSQCARLPHSAGLVTDLDPHLVQRALTSLSAELTRREHLLAGAGAKDLQDYLAARGRLADLPPIPRLVLIIDEFAGLVAELPDFVTGLVGIAQRGRSLGIHLVLATQRPSGVVSADIRANTTLRICLRVGDDADSRDVIDAPDAARISRTTPGRGLIRTGHTSLLPFQSARIGGRRPSSGTTQGEGGPLVWPSPWETLGHAAPRRPVVGTDTDTDQDADAQDGGTDLSALVRAVIAAEGEPRPQAVQGSQAVPGSQGSTRSVASGTPWLPPLPELLGLRSLTHPVRQAGRRAAGRPDDSGTEDPAGRPVGWSLDDLPAAQAQRPHTFTLGRSAHLFVVGGAGTGRSSALRTLTTALAVAVPSRDLHLYALDCGNGALNALATLPHTGAVVPRTATDRADRLIHRLLDEIARRQELLAGTGHTSLAELRGSIPPQGRPPYLMLAIDRWEGFVSAFGELDGGRLVDDVLHLLREGASAGLHVVISGDRSLLTGRISTLVEDKLLLRLPERGDYTLVGLSPRTLPAHLPAGRGLWAGTGIETQIAVLDAPGVPASGVPAPPDPSGAGQASALRRLAALAEARDQDTPSPLLPFRLAALPAEITTAEALTDWKPLGPLQIPIGVGGDDLQVQALDLGVTPVAVICGPARSGRTTALRFIADHARRNGVRTVILSPRVPSGSGSDAGFERVADEDGARRTVFAGPALDVDEVTRCLRDLGPDCLILIDDGELLREGPLAPIVAAIVRQARQKRWGVIVAADTAQLISGLTGWLAETRRYRQGLLLSPQQFADGEALGLRLQRSNLAPRVHPGRGLLAGNGAGPTLIQVPT